MIVFRRAIWYDKHTVIGAAIRAGSECQQEE